MRTALTAAFVKTATAEPGKDRTVYWDSTMPGFGLVVTQNGARNYVVQYRANKQSRRLTLDAGSLSLDQARKEAKKHQGSVARGGDPLAEERARTAKVEAAKTNTLKMVALDYFKREGKKIRTMKERKSTFERLVFPRLGDRQIDQIQRSDIVKLLDFIEDDRGPGMATKTLAFLSKLFAWHASRTDSFRSPIVRGMARTKPQDIARDRVLDDAEIVAVLRAADANPCAFNKLVTFLLLTGARRNEAARMTWDEIKDGAWTLPAGRNKTKQELVRPLSKAALAVLDSLPRIDGCPYPFTTGGEVPVTFVEGKERLDQASAVTGWRLHDLRRTARVLMSRAGVLPDVGERCLGHVIGGVRGVYDRYEYQTEMAEAFEKLAEQIGNIQRGAPSEQKDLRERESSLVGVPPAGNILRYPAL
jgi:integrase